MTVIIHNGDGVPATPMPIDADEERWVWFSWDRPVLSSEWVLPDGLQKLDEKTNVETLGDFGKTYKNCNGVLVKPTVQNGKLLLTNRCEISGNGAASEIIDRSVNIKIIPQ